MTRSLPSLSHLSTRGSRVSWPRIVDSIVFGSIFLLKGKLQPDTLISIMCVCHSCVYEAVRSLHWLFIMLSELYSLRINFISKNVLEVLQNIPSILEHLTLMIRANLIYYTVISLLYRTSEIPQILF